MKLTKILEQMLPEIGDASSFLNEENDVDQDLLEKIKNVQHLQKSYYWASQGWIPLTAKIAKVLNGEKRMQVFHVTSADNAKKLKALEGAKMSVSTMRRIPMDTRKNIGGVLGHGVLFSLDGDLVLSAKGDIQSSPDENGIRWINLMYIDKKLGKQFLDYISKDKRLSELKAILEDDYDEVDKDDYELAPLKIKVSLSVKEINEFLILYLKRFVEWLKSNSDAILKAVQSDKVAARSDYDEILVNNIELTGAIVNVFELEGSEKEIAKQKKQIESAVGAENVTYVNSYKQPKEAHQSVDKFILSHGGEIK